MDLLPSPLVAFSLIGAITGPLVTKAVEVAAGAVATAGAGILVKGALSLASKWHVQLTQAEQDALRQQVQSEIREVEEWAIRQALAGTAPTSAEKLDAAIGHVQEHRPDLTDDAAAALIHQELPIVRQQLGQPTAATRARTGATATGAGGHPLQ